MEGSGVTGFFLGEEDGVERGVVTFFEVEEVEAVVDDGEGDVDVALLGLGFDGGGHVFHGGESQDFFGGEFGWGEEGGG